MQIPSATTLLRIWETAFDQGPTNRALTLLEAAYPNASPDALSQLTIGQRDASLLWLRRSTFGSQLECTANCPECSERCEFNVDVEDLEIEPPPPSLLLEQDDQAKNKFFWLELDDYRIRFRLPTSTDLATITERDSSEVARQKLLDLCIDSVVQDGRPLDHQQLPTQVTDLIVKRMAELDAEALLPFSVSCPSCDHDWHLTFDIVSFFWNEINAWARRTLREVHMLASCYNWSESDILALSPQRRHLYLQMVHA